MKQNGFIYNLCCLVILAVHGRHDAFDDLTILLQKSIILLENKKLNFCILFRVIVVVVSIKNKDVRAKSFF